MRYSLPKGITTHKNWHTYKQSNLLGSEGFDGEVQA